jgi:hypothetical protein
MENAGMTEQSSRSQFYAHLSAFDDFSRVAEVDNYVSAPNDWFVVIADIRGSTPAIEAGRYKDVNMIGAACINAVLNVCTNDEIPYVFGGDGATLLIPPHRIEAGKTALMAVRHLSATSFDLELRVGIVPVGLVNQVDGCRVLVGKYQLSPGNSLATFAGGGIEKVESWIKSDPQFLVEEDNHQPPDLSGLSCRWEPLAAENGVMLSILVQARETDPHEAAECYRSTIEAINKITTDVGDAKPIRDSNMKFHWPPRGLAAEIKATRGNQSALLWTIRLYTSSLFQWMLDRFDWTAGGYRGRQYRVELRQNTDYRRFDDTLRILLDCSLSQADEIHQLLTKCASKGELIFGTHRSDSALMTCLVFNLEKKQHIHFVDGNHGGFTSASKGLKASRD